MTHSRSTKAPSRLAVAMAFAIGLCAGLLHAANPIETPTHRFTEVRNGIYLAQTTARVFNSNAVVIVNEDDVVVIDSHVTPAKGRQLRAAITEALTDKPISTLINSHHHWDHAHGNQVFTDVPIIGHEFTYERLAGAPLDEITYINGLQGNAATLERLAKQIEEAEDDDERTGLEEYLAMFEAHVRDFDEIAPVPPDIVMSQRTTLFRGSREIQIMFLGRAHTGGDVFVYFPQDKLLYTGDAAFNGPSYLGDGFVDEWPSTLMNMKKLDFDIFVPGHGPPVSDLSRIDLVADFYRDLWEKTAEMHAAGVSAQEASKTLDLTNHTKIPISEVGHSLISVERMYYRLSNPD
ncbi:MAG: MBL fold metallo-hydrolase [Acidobacteriota bacterium]|nr:MBL fold metallo-hydrolase [Acidobacteriota bacterium]